MNRFSEALKSRKFVITAEVEPPKGVDLHRVVERAGILKGLVDAVNVPDQPSSIMRAAPWAISRVLLDLGMDPIMQMTTRDRNRIAIQSDLLGASILGIENILCLSGDPTGMGDHPDAKAVFDLHAVALLQAAGGLQSGHDLGGHALAGSPTFCLGAAADPGREPLEDEIARLRAKAGAGARFIQTQPVFDIERFARFMEAAASLDVAVLAGVLLLKSGDQGRSLNSRVPGIRIPERLIARMDAANDRQATSVEIAAEIIGQVRPLCRGVHIMALGAEKNIPAVLQASGLLAGMARSGAEWR